MGRLIKWLKELLSFHCPKCGGKLKFVDVHYLQGGEVMQVYECVKCKTRWM